MDEGSGRKKFKVLFLCTGNSARSILAEFLLRKLDPARFEACSAGSNPRGRVNPLVLEVLKNDYRIDASAARSKSWEEFRDVKFDFVITVCDKARESCPIWPGQPVVAHWGSEDPDGAEGEDETAPGRPERRRRNLSPPRSLHRTPDRKPGAPAPRGDDEGDRTRRGEGHRLALRAQRAGRSFRWSQYTGIPSAMNRVRTGTPAASRRAC